MRVCLGFAILFAVVVLCGCSSIGVKPWQRDLLAKESMQLEFIPARCGD